MSVPFEIPNADAAEAFLQSFSRQTASKGYQCFVEDTLGPVECVQPGKSYRVRVAGGAATYDVLLFCVNGRWDATCTCPAGARCKHMFAAMETLLDESDPDDVLQATAVPAAPVATKSRGRPKAMLAPAPAPPPEPPPRLIEQRLAEALQRPLKPDERKYARKVGEVFDRCFRTRAITGWEFSELRLPLADYSWERLDIWPAFPTDEAEFWLYVANAARERSISIPEFMEPISDVSVLSERIQRWRRSREVDRWKRALEHVETAGGPTPRLETDLLDLRVRIGSAESALEWKRPGRDEFEAVKQTQFRQIQERFTQGGSGLTAEAVLIWQALQPVMYRMYHGSLAHKDVDSRRVLAGWLRQPLLQDRLVTELGQPFTRATEPLRWALNPAADEQDDYRLRLVRTDGTPLAGLLIAVPGPPALYLTKNTIYPGPPIEANVLNPTAENVIPAPAIESRAGVAFLRGLDLELPPRLKDRVQVLPLQVKIRCELNDSPHSYTAEYCHITLHAESGDGVVRETLNPYGWTNNTSVAAGRKKEESFVFYDRAGLNDANRLIEPLNAKWDNYQNRWLLRVTKKFPEIFVPWVRSLPAHIQVELRGELASLTGDPVAGSVRLEVTEAELDWFDLKVVLDVSDTELSPDELKILLNARGGWVRLGKKGWRRLAFNLNEDEDERLARLGLNPHELTAEPQRLHALQLADEAAKRFLPEQQVATIQRRVSEIQTRVTPSIPACISAELRPYQLEGFHFLAYLSTNRFGGILADDMGLGKTLQTLTWLTWLREQDGGPARPSLVVCPKSVMDNWRAEVARFVPGLRVKVWSPTELPRLVEHPGEADLHVLNYNQLRLVGESLAKVAFQVVILDEGQYIKNPSSITAQVARALRADHRLILTGTPIENRLLDLWSLMSFAMPGALGSRAQFGRMFDQKDDPFARRRLASRVRPFLLRRTKAQVARDLPDRVEEDLYCEIEGEQKTLYRAELKRAQQMLLKVKTQSQFNKDRFNFLTSLLRLRQICCDPRLVKGDSKGPSAKVEALIEQLEPLMEEGQKVLVFSQFVTMLDLLREELKPREWPMFYLAGDTENRGELVQKFQAAEGAAVFLISLRAGGFGLNLTAASYVVLFDPWWNPAVEAQAIDRTHRIGQVNKVMAYRLLIKDSIEEKIRTLQKQKSALAEDVLGEEKFAQSLTLQDLQFLFAD